MSGAGNLFSVLDNRKYKLSLQDGSKLAPALCHVPNRIRTEGLMLIDAATPKDNDEYNNAPLDFRMTFFNPDGSHGAMCGNGGRCAVKFAHTRGLYTIPNDRCIRFTALDTLYTAEFADAEQKNVRLFFPPPHRADFPVHLPVTENVALTVGVTDVGSDHAVVWFDELGRQIGQGFQAFDIQHWGSLVRRHPQFPRGANANFYTIAGKQTLYLRTFERGVEAETGACGTGAISTALIAHLRHEITPPITVIPTSGSPLTIGFHPSPDDMNEISLTGSAEILGAAEFEILREPT
jgi:diaminopimelate epimerase